MSNVHYQIRKLLQTEDLPFDLLLLADETIEAIEKYIYHSDVYVVVENEHSRPMAVFALYKSSDKDIEIKNIAVSERHQNFGIGSFLISEIKRIVMAAKCENIIVGTPDGASRQINFYEKNGFRKYDVRKDFFVRNYAAPIMENGVMLRDMVMLKMEL
jgi:ribosomal protein S18 acetylase RimI-like enzyme